MRPPGVLRIQKPKLSGWVACPGAASCPRTGGHRVSRGWCRRGCSFNFIHAQGRVFLLFPPQSGLDESRQT
jgi:hypothetical protein